MAKILVVEDDRNLAKSVCEWLAHEHHLVEAADDGAAALDMLRGGQYDLVIMDVNLPKLTGLEIVAQFRGGGGATPVLMLTARGEVADKEAGLDAGADDYLTKPFHLRELSARVRALLRRPRETAGNVLRAGALELDPTLFRVTRAGEEVVLARMEFALLEFLMRHPNKVFAPEALLERVWLSESDRSPESLRTLIKKLRRKIDADGAESVIENVHGVGYRLRA